MHVLTAAGLFRCLCIIHSVLMRTIYTKLIMLALVWVSIISIISDNLDEAWLCKLGSSPVSAFVFCSRWFVLNGRLVLKGCLGSHCVSQLMRGEGRDGCTSHRETDTVKTMKEPWLNTASTSRAQQVGADHNKVD